MPVVEVMVVVVPLSAAGSDPVLPVTNTSNVQIDSGQWPIIDNR